MKSQELQGKGGQSPNAFLPGAFSAYFRGAAQAWLIWQRLRRQCPASRQRFRLLHPGESLALCRRARLLRPAARFFFCATLALGRAFAAARPRTAAKGTGYKLPARACAHSAPISGSPAKRAACSCFQARKAARKDRQASSCGVSALPRKQGAIEICC